MNYRSYIVDYGFSANCFLDIGANFELQDSEVLKGVSILFETGYNYYMRIRTLYKEYPEMARHRFIYHSLILGIMPKLNFDLVDKSALLDHPSYQEAAKVASELMDLYVKGDIDEVDLIYHHFKSAGTQILTTETFLPIDLHADSTEEGATNNLNFIVEPSMGDIVNQLIPKSLHLRLYTALLDSLASEHAARVIAMQVATDNADDLLRELTLTYNKTRQQAITNELLDIAGGSAAQQ